MGLPRFASGPRSLLREVGDALASLIFPAPCRVCEATLDTASRIPVCRACLDSIRPIEPPLCELCGRPFISVVAATAQRPLCWLCRAGAYAFQCARSYAVYTDVMVRALVLLKYEAVAPLGGRLAARLAEVAAREAELLAADVVVPVPLHPTRLRERGYNQAELLARPLARRLGLPLRSYLLVRTRPRPNKLKLTRRERWQTVRGAYAMREGTRVDNLAVLLVDDVFTTGATLDACARALRRAGAGRVVGLTAARVASNWVAGSPADEAGRKPTG